MLWLTLLLPLVQGWYLSPTDVSIETPIRPISSFHWSINPTCCGQPPYASSGHYHNLFTVTSTATLIAIPRPVPFHTANTNLGTSKSHEVSLHATTIKSDGFSLVRETGAACRASTITKSVTITATPLLQTLDHASETSGVTPSSGRSSHTTSTSITPSSSALLSSGNSNKFPRAMIWICALYPIFL